LPGYKRLHRFIGFHLLGEAIVQLNDGLGFDRTWHDGLLGAARFR
jgi:hypothetical protein